MTGLQLAFLPGITHRTIVLEPTNQFLELITVFVDAPMPEAT